MKDKKGFILIETIVVMSIVMVSLLGIYRTYSTILKKSIQNSYYDNINDIYRINVILKVVGPEFLNQTGFYVINQNVCTVVGCTNIINNLVVRDAGTDVSIINIPSDYDLNDMTFTYKNSLIRYLETTNYSSNRLIVIRYVYDGKERFSSLEAS